MKALSFIKQRSFARYVMIDLLDAAARVGWQTEWVDVEGRLLELHDGPPEQRAPGVDDLERRLAASDADVVFSYGLEALGRAFSALLPADERTVAGIAARPVVYFLFDFGFPFDRPLSPDTTRHVRALQRPGSLVYCWDREALAVLWRYGVTHARHFPMAVNDRIFSFEVDDVAGRPVPIVFAGGPTPERVSTLSAIADLGLRVYSYDADAWQALRSVHHPALLGRRDMAAAYRAARIAVNVTRPHGPSSLNMRVFEAMASGCLVLTDDRADARELFTDGEHLCVYRSPADLRAQTIGLLGDEARRQRIARAGRARVLDAHTYERRLAIEVDTMASFVRETAALSRLDAFVEREPARALAFARFLEQEQVIAWHPEHLALARARASAATGATRAARDIVADVLARVPACMDAWRLAVELGERRLLPAEFAHLA